MNNPVSIGILELTVIFLFLPFGACKSLIKQEAQVKGTGAIAHACFNDFTSQNAPRTCHEVAIPNDCAGFNYTVTINENCETAIAKYNRTTVPREPLGSCEYGGNLETDLDISTCSLKNGSPNIFTFTRFITNQPRKPEEVHWQFYPLIEDILSWTPASSEEEIKRIKSAVITYLVAGAKLSGF